MKKVVIFSCYERTLRPYLGDILKRIYGHTINQKDFEIEVEDTSDKGRKNIQAQRNPNTFPGRIIRIFEDNTLKHIVGYSNTNYDEDREYEFSSGKSNKRRSSYGNRNYHSNSFLFQGIIEIFNYFHQNGKGAQLSFYILDTDKNVKYINTAKAIFYYRILCTLGYKILNSEKFDYTEYNKICHSSLDRELRPFTSINSFMNAMAYISGKNKGNKSHYMLLEEEEKEGSLGETSGVVEKYKYCFKTLGAESYESVMAIWCLDFLAKKERKTIDFILGAQNYSFSSENQKKVEKLSKPSEKLLKFHGIEINFETSDEFSKELDKLKQGYSTCKANNNPRNQTVFKNNLRKKGMPTECLLCGEANSAVLEAAHIWDVAELKKAQEEEIKNFFDQHKELFMNDDDFNLHIDEALSDSFFLRYWFCNCGDNGIWLCKNHHKLFDDRAFTISTEAGDKRCVVTTSKDIRLALDELERKTIIPLVFTPLTLAFFKKRNADIIEYTDIIEYLIE